MVMRRLCEEELFDGVPISFVFVTSEISFSAFQVEKKRME
jgi:hypothetical protein